MEVTLEGATPALTFVAIAGGAGPSGSVPGAIVISNTSIRFSELWRQHHLSFRLVYCYLHGGDIVVFMMSENLIGDTDYPRAFPIKMLYKLIYIDFHDFPLTDLRARYHISLIYQKR
jgi:hypothetical protein